MENLNFGLEHNKNVTIELPVRLSAIHQIGIGTRSATLSGKAMPFSD